MMAKDLILSVSHEYGARRWGLLSNGRSVRDIVTSSSAQRF